MCHQEISCPITGVAGNTETVSLKVSSDFYPIVKVSGLSTANPDSIMKNVILKTFESSDDDGIEHKKPYIEKKDYCQLAEDEDYFVPYVRMWPSSSGERIFHLVLNILRSKDNCSPLGDIYIEMPTIITGLEIKDIENNVIKDVPIGSSIILKLALTSSVDRSPMGIKDIPLIFYVLNSSEKAEVGRVFLSVAPKDVFSEAEMAPVIKYFEEEPKKKYGDVCITAVRKGLEKLLGVNLAGASGYKRYTMDDFMEYINNKGYIIGTPIDVESVVENQNVNVKTNLEEQMKTIINSELGFHVFTISLVSCYHTMTLIVDNRDVCDKIPIMIPDQNYVNSSYLNHLNLAINQLINGYWKQVKYKPVSTLWKITRLLLILLFFSSCGMRSNNEKDTLIGTSASFNQSHLVNNKKQIKTISNDSLIFCQIIQEIEKRDYKYTDEQLKCGKGVSISKDVIYKFELDLNALKHFSDSIIYYRSISFDLNPDPKPRCAVGQFIFTNDLIALDFYDDFSKNQKKPDYFILNGNYKYVYSLSINSNVVYIYASFSRDLDKNILKLKREIDNIINKHI